MEMNGEYRIAAPRATVWEALNDPEVLKQAIPGCESVNKTSDTSFEARVKAKVGPVSATFNGAVTLSDLNPPESYTISGEGKGGVAGFAKGGAKVFLVDEGAATLLRYEVNAQVGGKLAQIGARLIDGTAKKLAEDFFRRFGALAEAAAPPSDVPASDARPPAAAEPSPAPAPAAVAPVPPPPPQAAAAPIATPSPPAPVAPPPVAPATAWPPTAGHDPHTHGGHASAQGHEHHDHDHDHDHEHDHGDHHPEIPPELSDAVLNKDVGAGSRIGIWVTAAIVGVLILLAIFGLGGGGGGH